MPGIVLFYGHTRKWGEFSNFYVAPVRLHGYEAPTTEHLYQAFKTMDEALRRHVLDSPDAAISKTRGNAVKIRADWDEPLLGTPPYAAPIERMKDFVMYECLLAKFTQHHRLREVLLSTGDAMLVENAPRDGYWGNGTSSDGTTGMNMLGRQLMALRSFLSTQPVDFRFEGKP